MVEFNNSVFEMNHACDITVMETPLARICVIDNYYKNFNEVIAECAKLPYAITAYNNEDMFDGRQSYGGNMEGTRLPFPELHSEMVADVINYAGGLTTPNALVLNCNQALSNKWENYYYNAHTDHQEKDTMSTVVMLNESYDEGEGLNTYDSRASSFELWSPRTVLKLNTFIQAKPNRAILFTAGLPHGAAFNTSQFQGKMRHTQAIFTHLS